jgi:hypothetical protein
VLVAEAVLVHQTLVDTQAWAVQAVVVVRPLFTTRAILAAAVVVVLVGTLRFQMELVEAANRLDRVQLLETFLQHLRQVEHLTVEQVVEALQPINLLTHQQ